MPKAIIISPANGKPGKPGTVYYPLATIEVPAAAPGPNEVAVRMTAAALNHRDLFIRQQLYPSISFQTPLLADGCGVTDNNPPNPPQRVIINPGTGWSSDPIAPEHNDFSVLGGTTLNPFGTLQERLVISTAELEPAPEHLSDAEAAALPLAGLTAWRALVTKSRNAEPGRNLLVTGIGGGVALMILQFALARGCNVYVTSSSAAKIARATSALGAAGGVDYTAADWPQQLAAQLPASRPYLDAVLDGAGGEILSRTWRVLKPGGVLVSYGMTVRPQLVVPMQAVMKNIEVRGTMMGSRREFREMVAFVREKGVRPVVDRTGWWRGSGEGEGGEGGKGGVGGSGGEGGEGGSGGEGGFEGKGGLEEVDALFERMKAGGQFGKLVVLIGGGKEKPEEGKGKGKVEESRL